MDLVQGLQAGQTDKTHFVSLRENRWDFGHLLIRQQLLDFLGRLLLWPLSVALLISQALCLEL
jgi:hypothetical protein